MKIKITFEKIYDSDEFYAESDIEDLENLTFEQFRESLLYKELYLDDFKFKEIKE